MRSSYAVLYLSGNSHGKCVDDCEASGTRKTASTIGEVRYEPILLYMLVSLETMPAV